MAPYHPRQLLVLSIPTIAVLLSYLWFKRKRIGVESDPGDTSEESATTLEEVTLQKESSPVRIEEEQTTPVTEKSFSRSLSGVDTAPIDIILPREHRSKTAPLISDEDLDLEIEKIKSMKNSMEPYKFKSLASTDSPKRTVIKDMTQKQTATPSPKKQNNPNTTPNKKQSSVKKPKLDLSKVSPQAKPTEKKTEKTKMAQKDVTAVENKLCELKLDSGRESPKKSKKIPSSQKRSETEVDLHRQNSERDSANHSPADVMLASPSLSSISDNHSEGSSDSGKGGSEVATPPSRTPAGDGSIVGDATTPLIYEFVISQNLVGKLIGANGRFVTDIYNKTHANILVKRHPANNKLKLCAVEGTQAEIDSALKMVREKFPVKRYAELTLEQVSISAPPTVSLIPDHLYLKLVEGVNNDTIVSCMVAPNHLFLQQPTHPSFPNLNVLSGCMKACYSNSSSSPLLPNPVPENTICVAQSVGEWYRAMVLSIDNETSTSYVTFLDYGGFAYVENSNLRQIRGDFILLPFQAAECFLANIRPLGGDSVAWPEEAYTVVAELTKGALIYTQIAEYTAEGIPLVLMYILVGPQEVTYLNQELVNRGYAEWIAPSNQIDDSEGAVGGVTA